jgi:hypothetical protein
MKPLRSDLRLATAAGATAMAVMFVAARMAGGNHPAPVSGSADIRAIVATIRATRDQAQTDATLRLLANGPGSHRSVLTLRVRARSFGPVFKTLVEVQDAPSLEGRLLLTYDGTSLHAISWHREAATAAPTLTIAGPAPDPRVGWLSPCLLADDLIELHFWWPHQTLERTEQSSGRLLYVITSRATPADEGSYSQVTTWIDTERMAPVRAEKVGRTDGVAAQVSYDQWRHRDGRWMPGRVTIARHSSGCRVVLTALRGTTRANLPAYLFDPTRLAPAAR